MKIEVLTNIPLTKLGGSPLWIKSSQSLVFVDILGKSVSCFCPKSDMTLTMTFEQYVGFAVPTSRTKKDQLILLVGLENKIVEIDLTDQQILRTVLFIPEKFYSKGMRFNDGKCSPDGELFVGLMHTKWREGNRGFFFKLIHGITHSTDSESGLPKSMLKNILPRDGVHFPNGTAWLGPDTLFLVDSAENEITRLTFVGVDGIEIATKRISERKLIYKLPQSSIDLGYVLSGMTIDSKGKLWIALFGAGCILRIDPTSGQEVFRLHLEVKTPTSCTFGRKF
jgi:sugar lactone lactonase YvrE